MKAAWNAVSFLAVAHLLALLMFVGWLWQSGRLSQERVNTVRELFALTIDEAEQAAIAADAEAQLQWDAEMAEARRLQPPMPSEVHIQQINRFEEIEHRTRRRIEHEKAMLREQVATAQARLDEREARLQRERQQWLEMIDAEQQRRSDEQFVKTVQQYEAVRPRQGKEMLTELIAMGHMDQAVAYLNAMNTRAASRILGEFKTEAEIRLATELLEQLRTFGVLDVEQQNAPESDDARNLANAG